MAKKTNILIVITLLLFAVFYTYSKRTIEINIASVNFKFPAKAVVSATGIWAGGLDTNQEAFVVFPNGPYLGSWGISLQSSKDRRGNGMPDEIEGMLTNGDNFLSKNTFGWFECGAECGRDRWFFRKFPNKSDSTYSVGTVVCFYRSYCNLFLSYRDVDVRVALEPLRVSDAPAVLDQVIVLLEKYDAKSEIKSNLLH
ncbi:MAG: hypothetical protein ACEQSK_13105 [Sphingomonadaceae bacterium]